MILEWSQFDVKKGGILAQLLRLVEAFIEYERTGSRLEDSSKFAILTKCVSGRKRPMEDLAPAQRSRNSGLQSTS